MVRRIHDLQVEKKKIRVLGGMGQGFRFDLAAGVYRGVDPSL